MKSGFPKLILLLLMFTAFQNLTSQVPELRDVRGYLRHFSGPFESIDDSRKHVSDRGLAASIPDRSIPPGLREIRGPWYHVSYRYENQDVELYFGNGLAGAGDGILDGLSGWRISSALCGGRSLGISSDEVNLLILGEEAGSLYLLVSRDEDFDLCGFLDRFFTLYAFFRNQLGALPPPFPGALGILP